jgi:alpha-glucosidase
MPVRVRYITPAVLAFALLGASARVNAQAVAPDTDSALVRERYTKREVLVAMRDGVRPFTTIYAPRDTTQTYPILLTRTPYSVAPYGAEAYRRSIGPSANFARDGYIVVYQDVRGRYMSEGTFVNVTPAEFEPRWVLPMVQTTRAHNLSMFVIFNSPWTSLADSPDTYRSSPAGFDFIRDVPTSWDETRYVAGEVGQYIVLVKRKGDTWYLGAMNGASARKVSIPLSFLGSGSWAADLWMDGDKPDRVRRDSRKMGPSDKLELDLAATGGAVAVLRRR